MSASGHFGRNDREKSPEAAHAAFDTTDRRALRTRQSLHQALIRLILERDYDEITVGDITDAANVGRSTFYAHFPTRTTSCAAAQATCAQCCCMSMAMRSRKNIARSGGRSDLAAS